MVKVFFPPEILRYMTHFSNTVNTKANTQSLRFVKVKRLRLKSVVQNIGHMLHRPSKLVASSYDWGGKRNHHEESLSMSPTHSN